MVDPGDRWRNSSEVTHAVAGAAAAAALELVGLRLGRTVAAGSCGPHWIASNVLAHSS